MSKNKTDEVTGQYKDVTLTAKTEIGRSEDVDGKVVIQYAEASILLNLPADLPTQASEITEELTYYYSNDRMEVRLTDALRKELKVAVAEAEEAGIAFLEMTSEITQENWKEYLKAERRITGGKKVVDAVRKATDTERVKALNGIEAALAMSERTIDSLTDTEKDNVNEACGYIVFA